MFSIIVPIYNTKIQYLSRCINSLINQTINTYEIILIDDGSKKECKDFLKQYEKYKNITIIYKKHEGVSIARNTGIDVAKNDYIIFVDSDDYVENNMCEIVTDCINKSKNPDIVFFDICMDFKNKIIKNRVMKYKEGKIDKKYKNNILIQIIENQSIKNSIKYNRMDGVWCKVYKKEILTKNKIYFKNFLFNMEDIVFNIYFFENSHNIFYYNQSFYHYVKNNSSITNNYNLKIIENNEKALNEIEKFIKKYNKPYEFNNAINLKRVMLIKSYILKIYFNSKNNYKYNEAKQEIFNLIDKSRYKEVLKNINPKLLTNKQKIISFCIKHKLIILLKIITEIRKVRDLTLKRKFD